MMAKKVKGGRRQILQLEDKKPSKVVPKKSSKTTAKHKDPVPLDTQVADFFKEINALNVDEKNEDTTNVQDIDVGISIDSGSKDSSTHQNETTFEDVPTVVSEEKSCCWQAICDESTGYHYYWNIETNDVTWDCPPEYSEFIKNTDTAIAKDVPLTSAEEFLKKGTKKKRKKKDKTFVGAIIPITYFGGSSDESSNESSQDEIQAPISSTKNVPKSKIKSSSVKQNLAEKEMPEVYGPELPPNFEFPENIAIDFQDSKDSSKIGEFLVSESKSSTISVIANTEPAKPLENIVTVSKSSYSTESKETIYGHSELVNREKCQRVRKSAESTEKELNNADPVMARRPVVEYDSFTDDDGDSSVSPNKYPVDDSKEVTYKIIQSFNEKIDDSVPLKDLSNHNKIETSESNFQLNPKHKRNDTLDIDSLFMKGTHGKFGFGFSKQQQLSIEKSSFGKSVSLSSTVPISFVKSDQIFNLSSVNVASNEESYSKSQDAVASRGEKTENSSDFPAKNRNEDKTVEEKNECDNFDHVGSFPAENRNEDKIVEEKNECDNFDHVGSSKDSTIESENIQTESSTTTLLSPKKLNIDLKKESTLKEDNFQISNTASDASSLIDKSDYEEKSLENLMSSKMAATLSKFEQEIDEIGKSLNSKVEKHLDNSPLDPSSSKPKYGLKKNYEALRRQKAVEDVKLIKLKAKKLLSGKVSGFSDTASDADIVTNIVSLSSLLLEKISFLLSGPNPPSLLSSFDVQIQTRLLDWQAGALESLYFLDRLQEVHRYLLHYEIGCVSGDWVCEWDRVNKSYFYTNRANQTVQWSYPTELLSDKTPPWISNSLQTPATSSSEPKKEQNDLCMSSSIPENVPHNYSSTDVLDRDLLEDELDSQSSPPPLPPGVDFPSPPHPPLCPPESPPPLPPYSTEKELTFTQNICGELSEELRSLPTALEDVKLSDIQTTSQNMVPLSSEQSVEFDTNFSTLNAISSTVPDDEINLLELPQICNTSQVATNISNSKSDDLEESCDNVLLVDNKHEMELNIHPSNELSEDEKDDELGDKHEIELNILTLTELSKDEKSDELYDKHEVESIIQPSNELSEDKKDDEIAVNSIMVSIPITRVKKRKSGSHSSKHKNKKPKLMSVVTLKTKVIPSVEKKQEETKKKKKVKKLSNAKIS